MIFHDFLRFSMIFYDFLRHPLRHNLSLDTALLAACCWLLAAAAAAAARLTRSTNDGDVPGERWAEVIVSLDDFWLT